MIQFLNFLLAGVAKGAIYALIALGFVIVYRATHVLNFAQGAIMGLGGYLTYFFSGPVKGETVSPHLHIASLPYWIAVPLAMLCCAGLGMLIEWLIVRRFRGRPVFAAIMATLGVNILLSVGTEALWGSGALSLSSPFNDRAISLGSEDLSIERVDLFTLVAALAVAIGFYTFFKKTKFGTAMRAIAADQEAAMAQGISANKIFAMSWGIAMAIAALAGVMLSSGRSRSVDPAVSLFALVGFPAIVLGGIDSIEGALAGGMLIGIIEQIAAGYEDRIVDMVGNGFFKLTPYLLMLVILLVRPAGFFGTKEVRRV